MKIRYFLAGIALLSVSVSASAELSDTVAVYSTQESQGSMVIGAKSAHTKRFQIMIVNAGSKDINLGKFCLKAYGPGDAEFNLDTVDGSLTGGTLKAGKSVKGFGIFVSNDDAVYKASVVKLLDDCK